jgi:hypothetical protein
MRKIEKTEYSYIIDKYCHVCLQNCSKYTENIINHLYKLNWVVSSSQLEILSRYRARVVLPNFGSLMHEI